MTSDETQVEQKFGDALSEGLNLSGRSDTEWDAVKARLLSHYPMCTIVNEETYIEDDSSCPSGKRVYKTVHYQCDDGVVRRRKSNYCQ